MVLPEEQRSMQLFLIVFRQISCCFQPFLKLKRKSDFLHNCSGISDTIVHQSVNE
uniref:Uncharacterized protein n=1 Tax=Anopheles dirus TaxID=7168 RepID=A0A182NYC2_9DIPT